MKKAFKIVLAVVLVLVVLVASFVIYISAGLKSGANVVLSGIAPSKAGDGTYTGKYSAGRWSNELTVTIQDGKITEIKLVDDVTFAKDETTNAVFQRVIEAQNTTVDVVSGATVTSKAYLKAIENALNQS
jgi:uncharacterized protein with FMN-binding domain